MVKKEASLTNYEEKIKELSLLYAEGKLSKEVFIASSNSIEEAKKRHNEMISPEDKRSKIIELYRNIGVSSPEESIGA